MDLKRYWQKTEDWFKDLPTKIKNFPSWFMLLPKDEKAAYISIVVGFIFIGVGVVFL